jgi:HD-like signal output (HDOD) protein
VPDNREAGRQSTRILFVDDEPNILQSLRRALHANSSKWSMRFAGSAAEALQALGTEQFDVIATDLQMPGVDGVQLLATVMTKWPSMLRIITSGSCERRSAVGAARVAHQFLSKPYTTDTLQEAIDRAMRARHLFQDPALAGLVPGLDRLPTLPDNYARLTEALRDPSKSLQEIGRLVQADVGLTAKVLQVVNSAFFALPRRVASPAEAALFLGIDVLQSLVLATDIFGAIDGADGAALHVQQVWTHSMEVAARARVVGKILGCDRRTVENAFVAGLMHDIGALILCQSRRSDYLACQAAIAAGGDPAAEEKRVFGTTRARVAAYLLATWGLPDEVVTSVAFHERPSESPVRQLDALTAVHLAHTAPGAKPGEPSGIDVRYLESVGALERLPEVSRSLHELSLAAQQ